MGWNRLQVRPVEWKRLRHAHVPLDSFHCDECHRLLPQSYQFGQLGGLCWACTRQTAVSSHGEGVGPAHMASRLGLSERG